MAILASVVSDSAPTLSSMFPNVSDELKAVVRRCLEKDPNLRYPSVASLALALEPFAGPESRPLVGRIEGIVRAHRSSASRAADGNATSPYPFSPQAIPATLESARESPYGLESRTAPQPRPSTSAPPGNRWARFGVFAVIAVFGAGMYLVGALRPWNASERQSASAEQPAPPASTPLGAAPPDAAYSAPTHATAVAAALPPELAVVPVGSTSAASSASAPAAVRPPSRQLKNPAHVPSTSASATPPAASAVAPAPNDPFDQRR